MPKVYLNMSTALKNTIEQWQRYVTDGKLSPDQYNDQIKTIYDKIQYYKTELKRIPTGPKRAAIVHSLVDEIIKRDQKLVRENSVWPEVKCRKGCAHCCYQTVDITMDEADLLASAVQSGELKIDMKKLEQQSKESADADEFLKLPLQERKCIFLGDRNECTAYEFRPTACRKYFVVSDPSMCADEVDTQVLVLSINEAEIVASAALDLSLESIGQNMAKLLWKNLTKVTKKE
jgi:Fe-S-cluster containining protein